MILKKRRRKNSKRLRGFRRDVVTLRVKKIHFDFEAIVLNSGMVKARLD